MESSEFGGVGGTVPGVSRAVIDARSSSRGHALLTALPGGGPVGGATRTVDASPAWNQRDHVE